MARQTLGVITKAGAVLADPAEGDNKGGDPDGALPVTASTTIPGHHVVRDCTVLAVRAGIAEVNASRARSDNSRYSVSTNDSFLRRSSSS